jgi:hypothetical protein
MIFLHVSAKERGCLCKGNFLTATVALPKPRFASLTRVSTTAFFSQFPDGARLVSIPRQISSQLETLKISVKSPSFSW